MQKVLAGRYQLDKRLGGGGQGRVFRGRDLETGATVAVKLLDQGSSPEAVARFKLEGRLGARIRDPHLIAVLQAGVSEGQHFIVFDYIPRVVPLTLMCDHGRNDPSRVCEVALQVLDALATLHDAGVVHQDVSPANCLWRERDTGRLEVFLVDLGSAATRSPITGVPAPPRRPGGTSNFTAPEMMHSDDWDHRVDLWSVGALMYVLLTACEVDFGTPDDPLGIPPPAVLLPSIPQAVSDVVMRALAVADQRYPSATSMAEAIREALPQRGRPSRVPRRVALASMALVAVVAVLGAITAQRALGTVPATTTPPSVAPELATIAEPPPAPNTDAATTPASVAIATRPPAPVVEQSPPTPAPVVETPVVRKTKRVTWAMVTRAVKQQALDLAPCSEDEFISLGLRVAAGHVELETVDGKTVSGSEHHRCVRDVVARLEFPSGELAGVVGVPLPLD